jgi:PPOX class probable F420-dependent enzyme
MAEVKQKEGEFLDNPFVGVVTTLREDGTPHSTVVWVERENGTVSFNTARGRAKDKHLQQNPNLSLIVVDPENAYRWVAISGRGELTEEDADPQIDRLAKKYLDQDEYPWRSPDETRVKVVIRPEHVEATGLE